MFSEAYLAHPLHQLLNNAFPGRVHAAVVPPVLAAQHKEAGKKPRVDFAVLSDDGPFEVVVEAKWVSESHALLRDILRGVVRLDMLMPTHAKETLLILAGQGRYITGALQSLAIQAASWPFGQYALSPLQGVPRIDLWKIGREKSSFPCSGCFGAQMGRDWYERGPH